MKNILILLLLVFVGNSYANSGEKLTVATELPRVVLDAISERNSLGVDKIKVETGGALKWGSEYLVFVSPKSADKICSVYKYSNSALFSLFDGVPCEFKGAVEINESRSAAMPDVLYKIELFLPNRGAMVSEMIALFFDDQKSTYCLSRSLSDWYQNSDKTYPPDLSDGECGYGPGE
jgi:hypothetical protein